MTIGDGIFWSTVLILVSAAAYQASIREKWKVVGKAVGLLMLVLAVGGAAVWGWYSYSNRPRPVSELNGVRLGMTPVEVKLAKGSPSNEKDNKIDQDGDKPRLGWLFSGGQATDESTIVVFFGTTPEDVKAAIVCAEGGYGNLLGLGPYSSEKDIIERLGAPSSVSIHENGLSKFVSFKPLKVAFELTKGQVSKMCVTRYGRVAYTSEYHGKPDGNLTE